MNCRYEHEDPLRMPHRCNPTCNMTDREAMQHFKQQRIHLNSVNYEWGRWMPVRRGEAVSRPARSFVTRLVQR
jgi:hypothetical protein